VVLAGRPNTGKSSLFNALLGHARALVTEVPGTTRDAIEAHTTVAGWPVRLADTAGLREADDRIERLGVEVSRRYVAAADQVLLCVEAGEALDDEARALAGTPGTLLVRTKADLVPDAALGGAPGIPVSAVSGLGLDRLSRELASRLFESGPGADPLEPALTQARHRVALDGAAAALAQAAGQLDAGGDAVLAAHHVQEAVSRLEELVGIVHPDDVLGRIFERFCVGK
jgi:tRNA modification GTPase